MRSDNFERVFERGVQTYFHYVPLHTSPTCRDIGEASEDLPVRTDAVTCNMGLPLYYGLNIVEIDCVVSALIEVLD